MADEGTTLGADQLDVDRLPDAGDRFQLGKLLGSGICSNVYAAVDTDTGESARLERDVRRPRPSRARSRRDPTTACGSCSRAGTA